MVNIVRQMRETKEALKLLLTAEELQNISQRCRKVAINEDGGVVGGEGGDKYTESNKGNKSKDIEMRKMKQYGDPSGVNMSFETLNSAVDKSITFSSKKDQGNRSINQSFDTLK